LKIIKGNSPKVTVMIRVRDNLGNAIHKLQNYWKKFIEKDFF